MFSIKISKRRLSMQHLFRFRRNDTKQQLPVIVYIHGGAFVVGSAQDFCPNYLLEEDVILVTIQYRLGALGFLNLQIDEVPGNAGFMDQLLALEWINEHIQYFSGDSRRVTLFGHSAGAASVSLMLVSPHVRPGLFQKVILQSGNFLCDWVYDANPALHGENFARFANCAESDVHRSANCLLGRSAFEIVRAQTNYKTKMVEWKKVALSKESSIATASIQLAGSRKFLTENPITSLNGGRFKKMPVMIGLTKHEGYGIFAAMYNMWNPYKNDSCFMDKNGCLFNEYLKNDIYNDLVNILGYWEYSSILDLSKDVYFPKNVRGNFLESAPGLIDLTSDLIMKIPTMTFARKLFRDTPTYLYTFNHKGQLAETSDGPFERGVGHGDDTAYLFPDLNQTLNEEDSNVARKMVQLWAGFASNSSDLVISENRTWLPLVSIWGPYLKIDEMVTLEDDFSDQYAASLKDNNSGCRFSNSFLVLFISICTLGFI